MVNNWFVFREPIAFLSKMIVGEDNAVQLFGNLEDEQVVVTLDVADLGHVAGRRIVQNLLGLVLLDDARIDETTFGNPFHDDV